MPQDWIACPSTFPPLQRTCWKDHSLLHPPPIINRSTWWIRLCSFLHFEKALHMIRLLLVLKILHAVVVGLMTTHGVSSPYQMIDQCCWLCHVMINCQVHSSLQSHVLDQTAVVAAVVSLFVFPGLWLYADGWMSIGVMSWQPISLISISMYIKDKNIP